MQLIDYLPGFFREITEYEALMEAMQPEINALYEAREHTLNNQFVDTLDKAGCERWEKILGIVPLSSSSVEDRRFIIKNRIAEELPYSMLSLEQHLVTLLGEGNFSIEEDAENCRINVKIALSRKNQLSDVRTMLENMVPCNMVVNADYMRNWYALLGQFTNTQLSAYTHDELRNSVFE